MKLNKAQFEAEVSKLVDNTNLEEVGVLKQNEKGNFYMVLNINAGNVTTEYQGEKITGRLQGNIFLQNVKTSEFAEKSQPAKAQAATLSLADLKAALAARK